MRKAKRKRKQRRAMRVLYIRTNDIEFDSRASKEIKSILKLPNVELTVFGWKRDGNDSKKIYVDESTNEYKKIVVDIFAPWGRGPKSNLFPLFRFMRSLRKWAKSHLKEFDIVHCVDLPTAYYIAPIAKKHNVSLIYDVFDYFPDVRKYPKLVRKFFVRCENKTIKKSDVLILCTKDRIKQIGKAKYKRIEIIHNAPHQFDMNNLSTLKNDSIDFCYVGNLSEERCISFILDYFKKHSEYILHIGGIGNLDNKVKEYSERYKNIIYYGSMKYDDVLKLESKTNILLGLYDPRIPNHRFIAPNKFYETLALGKQMIAFKNTGLDSYFEQYPIGQLVDYNYESFDNGIKTLISNKIHWQDYGNIEKELFENTFSWNIMEQKLFKIYECLSQENNR